MTKLKNPSLRFKKDDGSDYEDWEKTTIRRILSIGSGKDYKHLGTGDIPVYGSGGYMLSVDKCLYEGQSVCIGRKGTIDNPIFLERKFWTVDTLFYTHSFVKTQPYFVYLLFQVINWYKYNEASGVPSLSKKTIYQIRIKHPSLPEQQKIADFLTAVDKKIGQLREKHRLLSLYKKGVMQKIFNQEIRFKKDDGSEFEDWKVKKLGDVAIRIIKKNTNDEIFFVLTNSAIQGIVSQEMYFDRSIANKDNLSGYYIVDIDDFVYNPRISAFAPVGPIKRNHLSKGVMSPLYSVFRFEKGNLSFFEFLFETTYWHRYMKGIANYGVRFDRMNITISDFFKMPVPFPTLPEQQKIADFLTAIDKKIEKVNSQITEMESFKKGLLQQMFV